MLIVALIFLAAALFSAVGLGGASGYLAAMAAVGVEPELMRPVSLALNVLVSAIAAAQFYRAGAVDRRLLVPLCVPALFTAFVGGWLLIPNAVFRPMVSGVLLLAAWRLLFQVGEAKPRVPTTARAGLLGAAVGLLSGLTGIGGGVFMTPALLLWGWADSRSAAGTTAAFIVVNSAAALAGRLAHGGVLPGEALRWAPAAIAGGLLGSWLGSRWLDGQTLRRLLAAVLAACAVRFLAA